MWKFVELGAMRQWRRRLEDRRGACLSVRHRTADGTGERAVRTSVV